VHRPSLAGVIEEDLSRNRFACVLGEGASGKTTLATLIALGSRFCRHESFYLDLADVMDSTALEEQALQALSSISARYHHNVLAIIDNIHLADECARELQRWHLEHERPVALLMLGRKIIESEDLRGGDEPLAHAIHNAHSLQVEETDLLGVFRRLAKRASPRVTPPTVPPEVLTKWRSVFGGDLFAFSNAVKRKLELKRDGWTVSERDASDYVWKQYMEPLNQEEREALFTLAWCQHVESVLPVRCLRQPAIYRRSQKSGLVWYVKTRRGYRFCHPGMGRLITAIEDCPKTPIAIYTRLAREDLGFGFHAASQLFKRQQDRAAAHQVLSAAMRRSEAFELLLRTGLSHLGSKCSLLTDVRVFSIAEIDAGLRQCSTLSETALAAPPNALTGFLRYALSPLEADASSNPSAVALVGGESQPMPQPRMPHTLAVLDHTLAQPKHVTQLKELVSRPSILRLFARKLSHAMPIVCSRRLYADSVAQAIAHELRKAALKSSVALDGLEECVNPREHQIWSVSLALLFLWMHCETYPASNILFGFPVMLAKHWLWVAQKYHAEEEALDILRLLGAGSLAGLQLNIFTRWPMTIRRGLLNLLRRDAHVAHLGSTILTWMGIRELASSCSDRLWIPRECGQAALEVWRSLDPNFTALKSVVINWLDQCALNNWNLLPDKALISATSRSAVKDDSWYPTELYEPQAGD
jgi:hypothetical protein